MIFHEGNEADKFYLIVEGKVAIEILANGRGRVTVRAIDAGEVLGWSWLVEPYRWHFDAQATVATKAIVFDANVVRESFSKHPEFGFAMMKGFLPIIVQRLQAVSDDLRFATALILS